MHATAIDEPVRSKSRTYRVGERHHYIYCLVQGDKDVDSRAKYMARLLGEIILTDDEKRQLLERLARLDERRSNVVNVPLKPIDPYWSLWGKIKSQYRRSEAWETSEEMDYGGGSRYKMAIYLQEEIDREEYRLPVTRLLVSWDGERISVSRLCNKKPRNDRHAVNFLRKLDTDEAYRASLRN